MQHFTKHEITWAMEALRLTAEYHHTHSRRCGGAESALSALRAEQLESIADRLQAAIEAENKRLEIKY